MSGPIPLSLLPDTAAIEPDGSLAIGGVRVVDLAAEHGTPLFVYDEAHLRNRCREAVAAFGPGRVVYATKAFLCTAMARLAYEEGLLLDVATGGELHVALAAGVPAERLRVARQQQERRRAAHGDHCRRAPHRRRQLRRARSASTRSHADGCRVPEVLAADHARRARPHPRVHRHRAGRLEVRLQPRQRRRACGRSSGRGASSVGRARRPALPHRLERVRRPRASPRRPR